MGGQAKSSETQVPKKLAIAAWVSPQLYSLVAKIAASTRRSLSFVVSDALDQYVERWRRDEATKNGSLVDAIEKRKKS